MEEFTVSGGMRGEETQEVARDERDGRNKRSGRMRVRK
jgi:hypothetical protein